MNLWCDVHDETHRFTPSAVERIVYALQAKLAVPTVTGEATFCPEETLRAANTHHRDVVDSMRSSRISEDARRRPGLRGRS